VQDLPCYETECLIADSGGFVNQPVTTANGQ